MGLSFLLKGNPSCCYLFEIQFLKLGKPFGIWVSLFIEFKGLLEVDVIFVAKGSRGISHPILMLAPNWIQPGHF